MKIKDFIKTEVGKDYKELLKGCNGNWECEHYDELGDLQEELKANGWLDSDIDEHIDILNIHSPIGKGRKDFVVIYN